MRQTLASESSDTLGENEVDIEHRTVGSATSSVVRQPIFLRYLEPYLGKDEITNVELPTPPEPNPVVIVQSGPECHTPKPVVFRELPKPMERFINVQRPPTPPRPIVIEKLPACIPKPPPILIEKWLPPRIPRPDLSARPPRPHKRKVIVVERPQPRVSVVKEYINLGTKKVDQKEYMRMLEKSGKIAAVNGKSIFVESKVSWEEFEKETGLTSAADPVRRGNVTMLNAGQLRI